VGRQLVFHRFTAAVGFTGSFQAGKALFDVATSRQVPIPFYAEMRSVNPVFILPDALKMRLNELPEELVQSVTLGVGQFCTKPGLIICVAKNSELHDRFLLEMINKMNQISPEFMVTRSVCEAYNCGLKCLSLVRGVTMETPPSIDEGSRKNLAYPALFSTDYQSFLDNHLVLQQEVFGPSTLIVKCTSLEEAKAISLSIDGQLTASVHATEADLQAPEVGHLLSILTDRVGRLVFNQYPTGVVVSCATNHGGPFPASTDLRSTSIGPDAVKRWLRPVCFQNMPQSQLPIELQDENPKNIWRTVNSKLTKDAIRK